MNYGVFAGFLGASLATLAIAVPAAAHISLEKGGTHLSRYGDTAADIKAGPCGRTAGTRGSHIYSYKPGETITVSIVEYVPHPGYFRIAFDNDGDDGFKEPASIKPVDPNRACPDSNPGDHCGASDFYNTPAVLPNMDNLNPHLAGAANQKYTWQVTLPNVECTNCTLQIIQVMEDDLFHGAYDPTPGVGVEDIYHQCIDLVLAANADGGLTNVDAGSSSGGTSGGSSSGTSGTGGSSGTSGTGSSSGTSGTGSSSGTSGTGSSGTSGTSGSSSGNGAGGSSGSSSQPGGCAMTNGSSAGATSLGLLAAVGLLFSARRRRERRSAR
jgi:hypothetical protein